MKWNTRNLGDVTVIDAAGRITIGEGSVILRDTIRDLVSAGRKKCVLNLADISYVDSSGIGEMVGGLTAAVNQGGSIKLLNPTKRVQELLKITHVDKLFKVFTDESAAVQSFETA